MTQKTLSCDLLVVGGGINGAGIARDAAGRGLKVILCEKDDLASHTSSASSKLIHGGLRYLEYYEFGLVRKALIEREILMCLAPHIISPIRFVMPHVKGLRPRWLLRAGLFLYDHLAHRALLPSTESIFLPQHVAGAALQSYLQYGFMYSDAWVDDARLVVLNAIDAEERGATILTRTNCESITQNNGRWAARLTHAASLPSSTETNEKGTNGFIEVDAACVVNATGSWAAQFRNASAAHLPEKKLRLIKGSHIVVKRLFEHPHAYIFQHPDGRIVFAIPYQEEFTLIGTTDLEYHGDINSMTISEAEIDYLCMLSNRYFRQAISSKDVLWSYSGVRPLVDDGTQDAKAITRDYHLELENHGAPILHVFGGKITTYRRLAEDALSLIAPVLNCHAPSWTASACLPGGDIVLKTAGYQNAMSFERFVEGCCARYHWLPQKTVRRYAHSYGTRIDRLLEGCADLTDMGPSILENLYARELEYLMQYEYAQTAKDILWRRTKLGLHSQQDAESILDLWISKRRQSL